MKQLANIPLCDDSIENFLGRCPNPFPGPIIIIIQKFVTNIVYTLVALSPSTIIWYLPKRSDAACLGRKL